jgi:hypothetical protein
MRMPGSAEGNIKAVHTSALTESHDFLSDCSKSSGAVLSTTGNREDSVSLLVAQLRLHV